MPAHRMTRELFELGIKFGAIHMDLRHIKRRVEMRALTRRVPGRARGQLALLDQDDIRPALQRQVIQQANAHNATTDNNHSGMRFHLVHPH